MYQCSFSDLVIVLCLHKCVTLGELAGEYMGSYCLILTLEFILKFLKMGLRKAFEQQNEDWNIFPLS